MSAVAFVLAPTARRSALITVGESERRIFLAKVIFQSFVCCYPLSATAFLLQVVTIKMRFSRFAVHTLALLALHSNFPGSTYGNRGKNDEKKRGAMAFGTYFTACA